MRVGWIVWIAAAAVFAVYAIAGRISSDTSIAAITLTPGSTAEVRVFRLFEDSVRAELVFRGDHTNRPELDGSGTSGDWQKNGTLRFDQPAGEVRIKASSENVGPIVYEAMPKTAHTRDEIWRRLTPDLSLEPGVWRWPPPYKPRLPLSPGFTTIRFEVLSVDPRLKGENVKLQVLPPLGFKSSQSGYSWLWFWFAWPLVAVLFALWAGVLIMIRR